MPEPTATIDRRRFLGTLVAAAATASLATVPGGSALAMEVPVAGSGPFEEALKKISSRKYKQVFDAPRPNESLPVIWSWAFFNTLNQLKVTDQNIGCVVVLRHEAIPFAMEDRLWAKYKFGEVFKIDDKAAKAPSMRNIVANVKPEDMPFPEMALDKMQARGVLFGVCDLAMTVYSMKLAEDAKMKPEDVKKDMVAGLLPGLVPLPSGVFAVNRAQAAGFTYCYAG
jgi:intracellular sulfur oxidation DsrE/DsrF family protein